MGRVSEQVESLRIEITSNQNARTLSLPLTSIIVPRSRIPTLTRHTHNTLQIYPNHPSQDTLYQSVAVNPNLCIANGSSVWVLR